MPLGMEVGLRPGDFVLDGTQPPSQKGGGAPLFGPCLLWPNGWMDQDVTWRDGRHWSSPHCARWGPNSPICGPSLLWPNGWMHQDATWYGGRPQPRRFCVRWGPSPLPQNMRSPSQFSVHVYYGQTAAWIKMPLGTDVGLGLCNIVFDVDPATPRKKAHPPHPNFGPCL